MSINNAFSVFDETVLSKWGKFAENNDKSIASFHIKEQNILKKISDRLYNPRRSSENKTRNDKTRTKFYKDLKQYYNGQGIAWWPKKVKEAFNESDYDFNYGLATSGKPLTARRIYAVLTAIMKSNLETTNNIKVSPYSGNEVTNKNENELYIINTNKKNDSQNKTKDGGQEIKHKKRNKKVCDFIKSKALTLLDYYKDIASCNTGTIVFSGLQDNEDENDQMSQDTPDELNDGFFEDTNTCDGNIKENGTQISSYYSVNEVNEETNIITNNTTTNIKLTIDKKNKVGVLDRESIQKSDNRLSRLAFFYLVNNKWKNSDCKILKNYGIECCDKIKDGEKEHLYYDYVYLPKPVREALKIKDYEIHNGRIHSTKPLTSSRVSKVINAMATEINSQERADIFEQYRKKHQNPLWPY